MKFLLFALAASEAKEVTLENVLSFPIFKANPFNPGFLRLMDPERSTPSSETLVLIMVGWSSSLSDILIICYHHLFRLLPLVVEARRANERFSSSTHAIFP